MIQVTIVPLLRFETPKHPTIAPLSGGSAFTLEHVTLIANKVIKGQTD